MTRLFFGVDIPDSLKWEIGELQKALQSAGVQAGNWTAPDLFHLTVLFLGDLPENEMQTLHDVGRLASLEVSPFRLSLQDVGVFPKNRILWLGLHQSEGLDELSRLHHEVKQRVAAKLPMVRLEDRPYEPHLTLARKLDADAPKIVQTVEHPVQRFLSDPDFPVEQLCLFASTRIEGRLVYPVLARYPLKGAKVGKQPDFLPS